MQVDILQRIPLTVLSVAEADVVKIDGSVLHLCDRVLRAHQIRLLVKHFHNPLCGSPAHGNHQEGERNHHQGGKHMDHIGNQAHQLACGHSNCRIVSGCYNRSCAQPADHQRAGIDAGHHQRGHQGNVPLRLHKVVVNGTGNSGEFLGFIVFPDKTLNHPDSPEVFLHDIVQLVIGLEHTLENRMRPGHNQVDAQAQHRQCEKKHHGNPCVDSQGHNQGKNQRQRRPYGHPQNHLKAVLHVRHVRGQPCDDGRGAEFVNVGEGKILNPVIHIMPQVPRKSGG